MKRLLLGAAGTLAVVAAVVVARAVFVDKPAYLAIGPMGDATVENVEQVAEQLSGAIQIETVSRQGGVVENPAAFRAFQKYLRDQFPLLHEHLELTIVNEYSLLYHWQGSDPALEPILLMAHYDVVPVTADSLDRWDYPPFSGAIADGYVWGRGALDDKGMIITQLAVIEALLAEGFQPARSIYLAYGHDEEVGGEQGAEKISLMLQQMGLEFALILDEGSAIGAPGMVPGVDQPVALLGNAEKGYLSLRLTARDTGGHSSMPPRHTAAGRIARAVTRLENSPLPPSLAHNRDFFSGLLPFMPFGQRLLLANAWLFESLLLDQMAQQPALDASLRTTTAVTMLAGSPKENVLPSEASAVVNFRIIPGETVASVIEHAVQVIDDSSIDIQPVAKGTDPAPVAPIDGPGYALLERTARQAWADDSLLVTPRLVVVTTDTRHYHPLSDHVFRFMPTALQMEDVQGIHGSNERVSLDNIEAMLRFYRQLILNANTLN